MSSDETNFEIPTDDPMIEIPILEDEPRTPIENEAPSSQPTPPEPEELNSAAIDESKNKESSNFTPMESPATTVTDSETENILEEVALEPAPPILNESAEPTSEQPKETLAELSSNREISAIASYIKQAVEEKIQKLLNEELAKCDEYLKQEVQKKLEEQIKEQTEYFLSGLNSDAA